MPVNNLYDSFPVSASKKVTSHGEIRLNPQGSRFGNFIGIMLFALIWNGMISFAFFKFFQAGSNSPGIFFILIFAAVGFILLIKAIKDFLRVVIVGDTYLVVNAEPCEPGGTMNVTVLHTGRYDVNAIKATLLCEEKVEEQNDKETKTYSNKLLNKIVYQSSKLFSKPGVPLGSFDVKIPEDAPYSFGCGRQWISWYINVTLDLPGRPDMDLKFPFRVVCKELGER